MDLGITAVNTPLGLKHVKVTLPGMRRLAAARAMLSFASEQLGENGADAFEAADYLFRHIAEMRGESLATYDNLVKEMVGGDATVTDEQVSGDDTPGPDGVEGADGSEDADAMHDLPDDDDAMLDDEPPL
jgi:hypothetical protein